MLLAVSVISHAYGHIPMLNTTGLTIPGISSLIYVGATLIHCSAKSMCFYSIYLITGDFREVKTVGKSGYKISV